MNSEFQRVRLSFGGGLTPVVRTLIWVNCLTYLFLLMVEQSAFVLPAGDGDALSVLYPDLIVALFGLVPRAVAQDWALWQPITYLFLHRYFLHLFMNMLALWWFGTDIERAWGGRRFFRYFLFTGVGAALCSLALSWNSLTPTIGASGAIFGILLAFGMMYPNRQIYLYFVLPVKAKYCVAAFGVLELVLLLWAEGSGINRVAHLGGMVFGLVWFGYSRTGWNFRSMLREWNRKRMRKRLRLVRKDGESDDSDDSFSNRTIH